MSKLLKLLILSALITI